MKTKLLFKKWSMVDLFMILLFACSLLGGLLDGWLLAAVFGVPALLFVSWNIWQHRKALTRWAKKHPIQTRILITLAQVGLMALGLLIGHNLYQLDIVLPVIIFWIFGALMILGFTRIPILRKKTNFILPSQLRKNRLIYAGLGLCLLGIMTCSGNRLEKDFSDYYVTKAVLSIDRQMFPPLEEEITELEVSSAEEWSVYLASAAGNQAELSKKELRKARRIERKLERKRERKAFLALAAAEAGGLLIFLSIAICLGVCIAGGGIALFIAAIAGGASGLGAGILMGFGGIAGFILGVLITRACVRAIRRTGPPPPSNL